MKPIEVEEWGLRVVAQLRSGTNLEDSRVELKSGPIPPDRLARRLAGHANAASGGTILWLLGVDETGQVDSSSSTDLATWWPQVAKHFDGPLPIPIEAVLYLEGETALAIAFSTAEAPYLVRNPVFGQPGGGPVSLEVPWRELTAVRTATHSDLVRLLVPKLQAIEVEVLSASLILKGPRDQFGDQKDVQKGQECTWLFTLVCYVVASVASYPIVVPAHRLEVEVAEPGALGTVQLTPFQTKPSRQGPIFKRTEVDHILEGPGRLEITADVTVSDYQGAPGETAEARVSFRPASHAESLEVRCQE